MKEKIWWIITGGIFVILVIVVIILNRNPIRRWLVDVKSSSTGLERVINVYTADGRIIATYEGIIDIKGSGGSEVKFDFDGKRYIYYNCYVETIANID